MKYSEKRIAEKATFNSFLNCYLRETGNGDWVNFISRTGGLLYALDSEEREQTSLCLQLVQQNITVSVSVKYKSPTGRHLFEFPIYYQMGENTPIEADYLTTIVLIVKELSLSLGEANPDELILRVIQSCQNMESFIRARKSDTESLYGYHSSFIRAEQALIFGHLNHPTPKSRQGFPEWEQAMYSPETKGEFQLHYYRAHASLVMEDSDLEQSATELLKNELSRDSSLSKEFIEQYCSNDNYAIIPVHPIQAERMRNSQVVKRWCEQGRLFDLGPQGRKYMPSSSIRTLYHPEAQFMLKLSLHVKITNSLRINKIKELVAGVEANKLMKTCVGEVRSHFPGFEFISDPAYITLWEEGLEESGFETILRENPFQGVATNEATLIAALVQDALPGSRSRLAVVIQQIMEREGRSSSQVSLDWFRRYVDISLRPMVWLYMKYGIALEAHQQNCVVELKMGYPDRFYYRDNQGYYYARSMKPLLDTILPMIGESSNNIYDDHIIDERFRYYLIMNHMMGLVNGFGTEGLIDERLLLAELRVVLDSFMPMDREHSIFLTSLLMDEKIPYKANLITRLYDQDELDNPLEQAVYVDVDNPLVKELPSMHIIRKAKQITFRWREERVVNG